MFKNYTNYKAAGVILSFLTTMWAAEPAACETKDRRTVVMIPGARIEAESFHTAAVGVLNLSKPNLSLDSKHSVSESPHIRATNNEDWLEYGVHVDQSGSYDLKIRLATEDSETQVQVSFDGADKTGFFAIPATESSENWSTLVIPALYLESGPQVMRVVVRGSGVSIDFMEFTKSSLVVQADAVQAAP